MLWQDARLRVVHVDEPGYTGYCRVIWREHVAEMTDLTEADRAHCMRAVFAVEAALLQLTKPDKINLASLGNFTPHVHWHVIARYRDDAHFPQAIWGARQRPDAAAHADVTQLKSRLRDALRAALGISR